MKKYLVLMLFFLVTACAAHKQEEAAKIFYPPSPSLARVQFLTFITGEKDFVAKKSAFDRFITGERQSSYRLDKPYGVAVSDGKIYVCDVNMGLIVFDLAKRSIITYPGSQGKGKLIEPLNIRIGADGYKYVTDVVRGQVVMFDKGDHFVNAFSSPSEWKPVDALPYEGQLYVADIKNGQIMVMDIKSGEIVRKIGQEGEPADRLVRPTNLAFDSQGHLLVSDMGRFQVAKYDRDGHRLGKVGEIGQESGTFARPKGVALDRKDQLYVVDAAFGNIQIFNKDGNLLFAFGQNGKGPGDMSLPAQVVVDYDNIPFFQKFVDPNFDIETLLFVTNQNGDMMVNVYALGKERGKKYPTDEELLEELKERLKKKYEKTKAAEEKGEAAKEKP